MTQVMPFELFGFSNTVVCSTVPSRLLIIDKRVESRIYRYTIDKELRVVLLGQLRVVW